MEETFSLRVKKELSRLEPEQSCCVESQLLGLLRAAAVLEAGKEGLRLLATTESAAVARCLYRLLKACSNLEVLVSGRRRRMHRHTLYMVELSAQEGIKAFLEHLGFLNLGNTPVQSVVPQQECCRKAYLRGFFLGAGSISNPKRAYHLELVTGNRIHASHLIRLLRSFRLRARRVERKGRHVVYLKEGDEIASFLTLVGAVRTRLDFENIRVLKGMRNQVNRLVNCETANMTKAVDAAVRQVESIRYLVERVGFDALPPPLREIARLRLEFPEATLRELGAYLTPPLGKSGVNHRLRRLEELAERLRD
ncbi:MAG: DNA-binding protein WhiA [bacterium]